MMCRARQRSEEPSLEFRRLHQAAVANDEATMNFECPVGNALLEGEFTGLRRAVRRIKNSALLVYGNSVTDFFAIEVRRNSAIEAVARWRSVFITWST